MQGPIVHSKFTFTVKSNIFIALEIFPIHFLWFFFNKLHFIWITCFAFFLNDDSIQTSKSKEKSIKDLTVPIVHH